MNPISYIFFRAYSFCINVFKEKEFPEYFAAAVVTMLIGSNIYVILSFIEYILLPYRFNWYGDYFGWFSLALYGIALLYVCYKKRYKRIIENCKHKLQDEKTIKVISLLYIFCSIISFFLIGWLIREYNLNH